MSEIKNIYCLGTSFTAGGGFEWGSDEKNDLLEKYYGHLDEKKTQYNYSWPGQLQKILNQKKYKIKVHNEAQSGYGLDTLFRKTYDIVKNVGFENEKNLFILEFSDFGRLEFYSNELQKFLVGNYRYQENLNKYHIDLAHSYFYDNTEISKKLTKIHPTIDSYLNKTYDEKIEFQRLSRQLSFFMSWLKYKKVNVIFSSIPKIYNLNDTDLIKKFDTFMYDSNDVNDIPTIYEFISSYNLNISNETDYLYEDFHAGLGGNKIISKIAFNYLINGNYIKDIVYNIDEEINQYHKSILD